MLLLNKSHWYAWQKKWIKLGSLKMDFLPAATVEVQLFEMQTPFLGSISKFINYFLALVLLTALHVLGPKWVETPFQDEVPRDSIKGVVMYHYVKNTNYNLAGKKKKKLAKYCLLQSANIYKYSWGSSALQEKDESSGYIMFWNFGAKTCFSHSISRKSFCFSHRLEWTIDNKWCFSQGHPL